MTKKYIVLFLLFIVPILAYVFFGSGVNNFAKLPILADNILDLDEFTDSDGKSVTLKDKITLIQFLGDNPVERQVSAYNLVHKIYKKNHSFYDFQLITIMPNDAQEKIKPVLQEINMAVEDISDWRFVYAETRAIERFHKSLQSPNELSAELYDPNVYIVDKDLNLRGRNDDKESGIMYGYNAENYAEINNKLGDDIKVLLAEYRLALKRNNRNDYLVQ